MTCVNYIIQSVGWLAAGLVVGYFLGRATKAAEVIVDATQTEGDDAMAVPAQRTSRFRLEVVVAGIVVLLGVFTAVQGYVQNQATERLTTCQTAYSNGFADAINTRTDANNRAWESLDKFMEEQARSGGAVPQAAQNFLDTREQTRKELRENPLPPAPRNLCD